MINKDLYSSNIKVSDWLRTFEFSDDNVKCEEYDHDEQTYSAREVSGDKWKEVAYTLASQLFETQSALEGLAEEVLDMRIRIDHLEQGTKP